MDDTTLEEQVETAWTEVVMLYARGVAPGPPGLVEHEMALLRSRIDDAKASKDATRLQRCLAASTLFLARLKLLARLQVSAEEAEAR